MSNMICFGFGSDKNALKDNLNMSNGGTSVFINVLPQRRQTCPNAESETLYGLPR